MKIIVVANQKGGVGKTTLTGHLAVQASLSGKTAIMDTDPQASLSDWWNAREAENPAFVSTSIDAMIDAITELRNSGIKYLLIDTPPAVSETIHKVVSHADMVVIPTRPGPHDLRAVGKTVDIADACGKKIVFVINGAAYRARITADAAVELSQYGAVAPIILYQRTDFASSMIDGRTAGEIDEKGKSGAEIEALWEYINKHLQKRGRA